MDKETLARIEGKLDGIVDTQKMMGERVYEIHGRVSKVETKASIFGILGGVLVNGMIYVGKTLNG